MNPPKFEWKRILRNTLTYGLALEIIFIGTGYHLYKEYKTNEEFRDRIEKEYPVGVELYHSISRIYLNFMPERLREKVLNVENVTTQSPISDNKSADK